MRLYQKMAAEYDVFGKPSNDVGSAAFMSKVLGLAGEAGEVCEKFKKILRDKGGKITDSDREEIAKELGDVLWYVTTIGRYIGVDLEEIAEKNIEKLASREKRGKLMGNGDNR